MDKTPPHVPNNVTVVTIDAGSDRKNVNDKTTKTFDYVYKHHYNEADWFMKAEDNTFVVLENLRLMLSSSNSDKSFFFGQRYDTIAHEEFFSGGAGYVVSKGALKLFATRREDVCTANSMVDGDVGFSRCMKSLGIPLGDSHDAWGKARFHSFHPQRHLDGHYPRWYSDYDKEGSAFHGIRTLSEHSISFHFLSPIDMYELQLFIYRIHVYGLRYRQLQGRDVNRTPDDDS